MIWTLKISCLAGPYHDGPCVRYVELDEESSLYDVHTILQEAVHFDDEHSFAFYHAREAFEKRAYFPEGVTPKDGVDVDLYEDVPLAEALAVKGKRLFYIYGFEEEWVFSVEREKGSKKPQDGDYYPLVVVDRNEGSDPMQYGNGEDDFADNDEAEEYRAARRRRMEAGDDDVYDDEDDLDGDDDDEEDEDDWDDEEENEDDFDEDDEDEDGDDDDDKW